MIFKLLPDNPVVAAPTATQSGPITEGDDVVLSCTADANPIPPDYITWERVGSTGSLSSCYNNGTSTLTLRSINREQAGSYRCRADNGVSPVVYSSPIQTIVHCKTDKHYDKNELDVWIQRQG